MPKPAKPPVTIANGLENAALAADAIADPISNDLNTLATLINCPNPRTNLTILPAKAIPKIP